MKKIRVNITVDKELLDNARKKLNLFGGKLSTLFNAYLIDFVKSMDKDYSKDTNEKIKELEKRLKQLEKKMN
jgi:hypothetical protein